MGIVSHRESKVVKFDPSTKTFTCV
jgi:hypothetical protein